MGFQEEVQWIAKKSRSTKNADKVYSMAFIETVYALWLQQNAKHFSNKPNDCEVVANRILFNVACRNTEKMKKCFI